MKKKIYKISKGLFIGVFAVILATVGIDAADHYDNFSQSIVGRLFTDAPAGPCPEDMAYVLKEDGGFCLDKYEAAPGEDCVYQTVADQNETRVNLSEQKCRPVAKAGLIPWRFISQSQAANACAKAGKRLPTEEEWYLASLGTPDKNAGWTADDCQMYANWPSQPGAAGTGRNCVSAAGAYDMAGNVWEWVKGEIRDGVWREKILPKQGYITAVDIYGLPLATDAAYPDENFNSDFLWIKSTETRGMARGGYWDSRAEGGLYSLYLVSPPESAVTGIGFRCAK